MEGDVSVCGGIKISGEGYVWGGGGGCIEVGKVDSGVPRSPSPSRP